MTEQEEQELEIQLGDVILGDYDDLVFHQSFTNATEYSNEEYEEYLFNQSLELCYS